MKIFKNLLECRESLRAEKKTGKQVAFVPTMGALHEGHLTLVDRAKTKGEVVVMSIYVNTAQFGPNDDLNRYPRPIEKDIELAESRGVDVLLIPKQEEVYPPGYSSFAHETMVSKLLCGEFRRGYYQGICTVLLKFIHIVEPDFMVMGEKDAQQVRVVEKMIEDFHLETQVVPCPTVREEDGLAQSSRNSYLSSSEREKASLIYQGLQKAHELFKTGERRSQAMIGAAKEVIMSNTMPRIQYLEVVRWKDFAMVGTVEEKCVLATAVYIGNTRLIDNVMLVP